MGGDNFNPIWILPQDPGEFKIKTMLFQIGLALIRIPFKNHMYMIQILYKFATYF